MTMAALMVVLTIGAGLMLIYKEYVSTESKMKRILKFNIFTFIPLLVGALVLLIPDAVHAAKEGATGGDPSGLAYIAAALSTGMATIGAGYAVGAVGSSALGAVSEDPKILGKTLIFVGLAEGVAIYGLIVSIFILFV